MAQNGFIKLHRQITEHEFFKEPRKFSKFEAWLYILLNAKYQEEIKRLYGADVLIPAGSFPTSYNQLAKEWGWDKKTVRKFIDYLIHENMITVSGTKIAPKSGTKTGTIINIENWAFYQGSAPKTSPKSVPKSAPKNREPSIIYKEEKNIYSEILFYWNQQKIIVHKEVTDEIVKAIDKTLKLLTIEQIKTCISRYSQILKDESYFFNYQWTLIDFLNRKNGVKDFLDDGPKWVNYQNEKKTKAKPQAPRLFDELGDPIPGALDKTPI